MYCINLKISRASHLAITCEGEMFLFDSIREPNDNDMKVYFNIIL